MKEIKTSVMNLTKPMTPTEAAKRMICRAVEKYYSVHVYRAGVVRDDDDTYDFEVYAVSKNADVFCSFSGFVGGLGQVVIYSKDGNRLPLEAWETIL